MEPVLVARLRRYRRENARPPFVPHKSIAQNHSIHQIRDSIGKSKITPLKLKISRKPPFMSSTMATREN